MVEEHDEHSEVNMVKVVTPTNFCTSIDNIRYQTGAWAMKLYSNRHLLLSFTLVLALSVTAIVYIIACDATRCSSNSLAVARGSELTQGRLTVLYSKQRRTRQHALRSKKKAAVRRINDESVTPSTAATEQPMSVNGAGKKVSVWDRQDKEWRILDDVIESILRNDDQWSSKPAYEALPHVNRTAAQQSYNMHDIAYPLLREYLIRYSNWTPPKPGEGRATQMHTNRKNLCMDNFCLSQLEPGDEKIHFLCLQRSLEYSIRTDLLQNGKSKDDILAGMRCNCTLLKNNKKASRKRVVLSSLPGSGNTWVRQLLESVTGICTGSMWCDPSLRANHFCGEGQHGRSFLVIKDHSGNVPWSGKRAEERDTSATVQRRPDYDAMILVHRDPFDATVAEWNRALFDRERNSSHGRDMHIASYGPEMFGENPEWEANIHRQAKKWKSMIYNHVIKRKPAHPLLVVRYEDLKRDSVREVQRMLDFLDITIERDDLVNRLQQNSFSKYRRNHTSSQFNPYTPSQIRYWNSVISDTEKSLRTNGITNFVPLRGYLRR